MNWILVFVLSVGLFFSLNCTYAQEADTVNLHEVIVNGYLSRQPLVNVPASVAIVNAADLGKNSHQSLLPALNVVPGLRMEERSPGSYRLSIRGSLLRSPFGVRNVKVYLNNLPLTDASGNTYINLVDPALIQQVEILKGPDGSLFGANSGGVTLFNTDSFLPDSSVVDANVSAGFYGLFREHVRIQNTSKRLCWSFGEAFQRADGYREQSFMRRLNLMGSGKLNYGSQNSVALFLMYSDLHYETPGGLTQEQFQENPAQARPGTTEQQTGIYNKTFFGGITNEVFLVPKIKHVFSLFSTFTSYENPFITNYEVRDEKNAGIRTFIEYTTQKKAFELKCYVGLEGQLGNQNISNYQNDLGQQGALQSSDEMDINQAFYFTRITIDVNQKLTLQGAVSLNQYQYSFNEVDESKLDYEWMPRLATSYRFVPSFALRASVSRGYSPPTIAEIRPSGAVLNKALQAESGWSREVGFRFSQWNDRLQFDASVFRYDLQKAITRRTDENDVEYFLNAGSTKQTGVECFLHAWLIPPKSSGLVHGLALMINYTYSHFLFDKYENSGTAYSGNWLTGVPKNIVVTGLTFNFSQALNLYLQSTITSRIPLNDANSVYADQYQLLQARLGWKGIRLEKVSTELFVGGDNLFDQHYSLGNDINAFGGRYYNAALLRNFYFGLQIKLH